MSLFDKMKKPSEYIENYGNLYNVAGHKGIASQSTRQDKGITEHAT
jgi:hypothetical protein